MLVRPVRRAASAAPWQSGSGACASCSGSFRRCRYWWLLDNCRFPGVKPETHPLPFHCPFDHVFDLEKWVHSDVPMRECAPLEHIAERACLAAEARARRRRYSFLDNPRVSDADRRDSVHVRVDGASEANRTLGRALTVGVGSSYARVAGALKKEGLDSAFVVKIDARSLELLCEDLGSEAENAKFNGIIHRVLGVAEQIRYCDREANPWFEGAGKNAPYDNMKNPLNCTWGFHRPPALSSASCPTQAAAMLAARMLPEQKRQWTAQPNAGMFANYHGVQTWSTSDRVLDVYREYV